MKHIFFFIFALLVTSAAQAQVECPPPTQGTNYGSVEIRDGFRNFGGGGVDNIQPFCRVAVLQCFVNFRDGGQVLDWLFSIQGGGICNGSEVADSVNNNDNYNNLNLPPRRQCGSIIDVETLSLGEKIELPFTDQFLSYSSRYAPGNKSSLKALINVSGESLPSTLVSKIDVKVEVAGRTFTQNFAAAPNLFYDFAWDGLDSSGQMVMGPSLAKVTIDYIGSIPVSGVNTVVFAEQVLTSYSYNLSLGNVDYNNYGIGGWSLSNHHFYNTGSNLLRKGDGVSRKVVSYNHVLSRLAGSEFLPPSTTDGTPPKDTGFAALTSINAVSDVEVFVSETVSSGNAIVRKIDPVQVVTVAGAAIGGTTLSIGQSAAAGTVKLEPIVATASIGSDLYIATGSKMYRLSGGQITYLFQEFSLLDLTSSNDSLYFSTEFPAFIKKYDPATQQISVVAGDGNPGTAFDQNALASIAPQKGLSYSNGLIYYNSHGRQIRSVSESSSTQFLVAGSDVARQCNESAIAPDGNIRFFDIFDIAVTSGGSIVVSEGSEISQILNGQSRHLAGDCNSQTISQSNGFGMMSVLAQNNLLDTYTDGSIAFLSKNGFFSPNSTLVNRLSPFDETSNGETHLIASSDASELYFFDKDGKHVFTKFPLTGKIKYQFTYNGINQLTSITDHYGKVTMVERLGGAPTGLVLPFGQAINFSTSPEGYITSVAYPGGQTYNMTYLNEGLLGSFQRPGEQASQFAYNSDGLLSRDTDALGGFKDFQLILSNNNLGLTREVRMTTAEGRSQTFFTTPRVDDVAGFQKRTVFEDGTQDVTDIELNIDGELKSTNTLLASGDQVFVSEASSALWDKMSTVPSTTVLNSVNNYQEQRQESLNRTGDDFFSFVLSEFTSIGQVGRNQSTVTDSVQKTRVVTSPEGRQQTIIYGDDQEVDSLQIGGLAPIVYQRNSLGQLTNISQGARVTTLAYNPEGLLSSVDQAGLFSKSFNYDASGRVIEEIDGNGLAIRYAYDEFGNLTSVTPGDKSEQVLTYDNIGQLIGYLPAQNEDGGPLPEKIQNKITRLEARIVKVGERIVRKQERIQRKEQRIAELEIILQNPNLKEKRRLRIEAKIERKTIRIGEITIRIGELEQRIVSFQQKIQDLIDNNSGGGPGAPVPGIQFEYDLDRRLTARVHPDSSRTSFAYNSSNQLSTVTSDSGNKTLTYNPKGQLESISSNDGINLQINYSDSSKSSEVLTGAVEATINYSYDGQFRLASYNSDSITYDNDGLINGIGDLIYTRDNSGLITELSQGNVTESIGYNSFGEMASQDVQDNSGTILGIAYQRDNLGRVSQLNDTNYTYDNSGRLSNVTAPGYSAEYVYDSNGNRTSQTINGVTQSLSYNGQDQLLSFGSTSYSYDELGNLRDKTAVTGVTTYAYDQFGNLDSVTLPTGDVVTYLADGFDRRSVRSLNGAVTDKYIYLNQTQIIRVLDENNQTKMEFYYGLKPNVPDYMVKDNVKYRIISNHIGSVERVIDVNTGALVQSISYDEFGNVITDTNPGFQPFGFAGGLYDQTTKLTRFGARDYDAEAGRWTARDPILLAGGDTNLYGYTFNDPINLIDPSGLIILTGQFNGEISLSDSPASTSGRAGSSGVGFGFDTRTLSFFFFETFGNGNSSIGAFGGVGFSLGFFDGTQEQFFGPGECTTIGVGGGLNGGGINFNRGDAGGSGFSFDFFGPSIGLGGSTQRTETRRFTPR